LPAAKKEVVVSLPWSEQGVAGGGQGGASFVSNQDVRDLLHVMAELACMRNDPRRWRIEALTSMMRMLPASASVALIVQLNRADPEAVPTVQSIFDLGFKGSAEHEAFLNEFNEAPLRDPLCKRALQAARHCERRTVTMLRREVVEDAEWYSSSNVDRYRRLARVDDCVVSVHRNRTAAGAGTDAGELMMVWMAFRGWGEPARFTGRERQLVDALHGGLEWLYLSEETLQRVTRATALSPRLRQTLDYLLGGDTERQVAARMSISIHTVHDYVKALYVHFGVSSRMELMARWIQSGASLPTNRREE
jgi:DNA-binding CsgD family transcriptional regulator